MDPFVSAQTNAELQAIIFALRALRLSEQSGDKGIL